MATRELRRQHLAADPVAQFRAWISDAVDAGLREPNAMAVCSADLDGRPSARMVLLKSFDERGFVFATNYESRKARELDANPKAALLFYWQPLDRQIRIEGRIERTGAEESDAIFQARPRGARIGAWVSKQSRPIPTRADLEQGLSALDRRFPDTVPRPDSWGGYRLRPAVFEFWQGRAHRLHDRMVYRADGDGWAITRLAP